jgi:hypothetical protein
VQPHVERTLLSAALAVAVVLGFRFDAAGRKKPGRPRLPVAAEKLTNAVPYRGRAALQGRVTRVKSARASAPVVVAPSGDCVFPQPLPVVPPQPAKGGTGFSR